MTRFFKLLTVFTSLFLLSFTVSAETKQSINVSGMEWNAIEFVYDDTIKTVELVNVPSNITITYENNSFKEVGTYFARAILNYDNSKYFLTGYDPDKFESHCWTIVRGKYNTSNLSFKDTTIVYDNKAHSIYANNIPEGVEVSYTGNERVEPGIYEVTAVFKGHPYYNEIPEMKAILTINKRELVCDDGECKIRSDLYGFNPYGHLKHIEIESEEYKDLDLSNLGSYREVKNGFKLTLYDENNNVLNINDEIIVEIKLSEELNSSDVLEVYEYSTSGISKVNSNRSNGVISFSISSLNSEFLLIGMRETYSKGDNWKIGIIFLVVALFVSMIFCIKKIQKKHRFK